MFGHDTVCSMNKQASRFVNVLELFHFFIHLESTGRMMLGKYTKMRGVGVAGQKPELELAVGEASEHFVECAHVEIRHLKVLWTSFLAYGCNCSL